MGPSLADPAPFGLELGKATLKDIEANHKIIERNDAVFDGKTIKVDANLLGIKGLEVASFYVDKDGVVQATILTMDKDKFNDMLDVFSEKYKLVSKEIPFVGNKSVSFEDGGSIIIMNAPHLSFNMEIVYQTKKIHDALNNKSNEAKTDEKKREKSLL